MNQQQITTYPDLDWQQLDLIMRAARRERSDFVASLLKRLRRRKNAEAAQPNFGGMAQAS